MKLIDETDARQGDIIQNLVFLAMVRCYQDRLKCGKGHFAVMLPFRKIYSGPFSEYVQAHLRNLAQRKYVDISYEEGSAFLVLTETGREFLNTWWPNKVCDDVKVFFNVCKQVFDLRRKGDLHQRARKVILGLPSGLGDEIDIEEAANALG